MVSLLPSCTESVHVKESLPTRIIHNVPFYPQEDFQCGPASLTAVLNFWGVQITPEEIARDIYSPSARGTLTLDMIGYPAKKGMEVVHYQGSMDDLRKKIDSGHPMIVLVDLGFLIYQQNHFMVIVGYEEDGVVAHSGKEPLKHIPLKSFMKTWAKTNYWTLWIKPLP
jgi:predicted double-glycine peptidase